MTILDSNGVYGADTNSPMLAPKGVLGRTDGLVATGMIGESLVQSFTGLTLTTGGVLCATISAVPPGRYLTYVRAFGAQVGNTGASSAIGGTATYTIDGASMTGYWHYMINGSEMINGTMGILKVTVTGTITYTVNAITTSISNAQGDFVLIRIA